MRTYGRAAALTVGLALLILGGISSPAFAPPPGPPGPPPSPCEISSVSIHGPAEGTIGENLTFQGEAETKECSSDPEYNWTLQSAPEGAPSWSATGPQVSFTPSVAGDYILKLNVTADATGQGSAEHKLTVVGGESQPEGAREYALIIGQSNSQLQAYPNRLTVSAGTLRLFLTSLDQAVTVLIRREGTQTGISTALVEPGKLTTIEVELTPGVYEFLRRGTDADTVLGRIEAR